MVVIVRYVISVFGRKPTLVLGDTFQTSVGDHLQLTGNDNEKDDNGQWYFSVIYLCQPVCVSSEVIVTPVWLHSRQFIFCALLHWQGKLSGYKDNIC